VPYRYREYLPVFGSLPLRMRTRKWRGMMSVPVLLSDEGAFTDSWDIANYAHECAPEAGLFPTVRPSRVKVWNAAAERLLVASRIRLVRKTMADPEALYEAVPRPLKGFGRTPAVWIGRYGAWHLGQKYPDASDRAARHATSKVVLDEMREALESRDTLLEEGFSYADILMATALNFVDPHPSLNVGPHTRDAFYNQRLATDYEELIAWRDRVYERWPRDSRSA